MLYKNVRADYLQPKKYDDVEYSLDVDYLGKSKMTSMFHQSKQTQDEKR